MSLFQWFLDLIPDGRPGFQVASTVILVTFVLAIVGAVVTSLATVFRGEPPWRWPGDRPVTPR